MGHMHVDRHSRAHKEVALYTRCKWGGSGSDVQKRIDCKTEWLHDKRKPTEVIGEIKSPAKNMDNGKESSLLDGPRFARWSTSL